MKAIINAIDGDGVAVAFQTEEMKLTALLALVPQVKAALVQAGYELVDSHPAQTVEAGVPAPGQQFAVSELTATVSDGKAYWRVKGGQFQKWGVIVYPEVLEAAGLGELNPLQPWSEAGWLAEYCLKENGKPKKVTRLWRAS